MRKRWNMSLYYRLIALFIVTLLPLYLLSFALNELSMKDINAQKVETLSTQASNALIQFEKEIQRISSFQNMYLLTEENIIHFSSRADRMSAFELGKTVSDLYKHLIIMKFSSDYVSEVFVYSPSQNKAVSTASYYQKEFTEEELEFYTRYGNPSTGVLKFTNDRLHLSFNYPIIKKDWEPLNFVQVELSKKEIQDMLNQIDEDGGAALIGNGWIITSREDTNKQLIAKYMNEFASPGTSPLRYNDNKYLVTSQSSSLLNVSLVVYVPERKILDNLMFYRNLIWALLIVSLLLVFIIMLILNRMIKKPLRNMVSLFMEVERGNYEVSVDYAKEDDFGYLYRGFRKMLGEINRLINETYRQKIRVKNSELKQLQTQINPHFLYNTFNILRHSIKYEDYDTAEELSKHLGGYFHFITRNDKDDVYLEFEYQHIITYLSIQKIRNMDRISISVEPLPEEFAQVQVPRLILQPLIENVYNHSFNKMYSGGKLMVSTSQRDHEIVITIEDNGDGLTEEKLKELRDKLHYISENEDHTGLINIHRRLQLKYGDAGRLEVSNVEPQGFRVSVIIPKMEGKPYVPTVDRG